MVRFLLLSDLHLGPKNSVQSKILDNILDRVERDVAFGNLIDFVILTGDISASAQEEEFNEAHSFLEKLGVAVEVDPESFIIVPGNHDYNRGEKGTEYKYVTAPTADIYRDIFRDKHFEEYLNRVFNNFNSFLRNLTKKVPNLRGYSKLLKVGDMRINVTVLNSCLTNTLGEDKNQPFIDIEDYKANSSNKEDFDLSILVMHHPPQSLSVENRRQIEALLSKSFNIVITGHEHSPDYRMVTFTDEEEVAYITNGSAFQKEEPNFENRRYRFSIIDYNAEEGILLIHPWQTEKNIDFCATDTTISRDMDVEGNIELRFYSKGPNKTGKSVEDPVPAKIPPILLEFFKKYYDKLLRIVNKQEFQDLKSSLKHQTKFELKTIAEYFLRFLLDKKTFTQFAEFQKTLSEAYVFSFIQRKLSEILAYYDTTYFERIKKDTDLISKISRGVKSSNLDELRRKLVLTEKELSEEKSKTTSILERYIERPLNLHPALPIETAQHPQQNLDWYDTFGLVRDPFPSNDGFENIESVYYEKIIVSTRTIEDFKALLLSPKIRDLTNKTIAIYGSFGSGKTVLFQYLDMLIQLHLPKIISITVSLDARESREEIRTEFFSQLSSSLRKIHLAELGYAVTEKTYEECCKETLENLAHSKTNLFIFIEDIYKQSARGDYKDQVIGFIRSLQILKRVFSSTGIKTSFFFSSIIEIVESIRNDHSISGSVDNFYEMSVISLEDALLMINKRFQAFAKIKENPPKITAEFLLKLKKIEESSGTSVKTFRNYIDLVKERLQRREYDEDTIKIGYNLKTLTSLKSDIETNYEDLHQSFTFLKSCADPITENFKRFIIILEHLWLKDPISEDSKEYHRDKAFLTRLVRSKLIVKKLQDGVVWDLSDSCRKYFDQINTKYGIYPSNIIPQMYYTENIAEEHQDKVIKPLRNLLVRGEEYGKTYLDLMRSIIDHYEKISQFSRSLEILTKSGVSDEILTLIQESFKNLLIAFVIQCDDDVSDYQTAINHFEESWFEVREGTIFAEKTIRFSTGSSSPQEKIELLKDYLITFQEIVKKLQLFVQWDSIFTLKGRKLWNNTKKQLNLIRSDIEYRRFKLAQEKIGTLLFEKIQSFFFEYCQVLYGKEKWKRGAPQPVNGKIQNILAKLKKGTNYEEKEILTFLELKDLFACIFFLNDSKTKKQIKFLAELATNCRIIQNTLKLENPWCVEILDTVEFLDNFNSNLLSGSIPTPWNSDDLQLLEDVVEISDFPNFVLNLVGGKAPLLLNSSLQFISPLDKVPNFVQLVYWTSKNKAQIEITTNYRKEKISLSIK